MEQRKKIFAKVNKNTTLLWISTKVFHAQSVTKWRPSNHRKSKNDARIFPWYHRNALHKMKRIYIQTKVWSWGSVELHGLIGNCTCLFLIPLGWTSTMVSWFVLRLLERKLAKIHEYGHRSNKKFWIYFAFCNVLDVWASPLIESTNSMIGAGILDQYRIFEVSLSLSLSLLLSLPFLPVLFPSLSVLG